MYLQLAGVVSGTAQCHCCGRILKRALVIKTPDGAEFKFGTVCGSRLLGVRITGNVHISARRAAQQVAARRIGAEEFDAMYDEYMAEREETENE